VLPRLASQRRSRSTCQVGPDNYGIAELAYAGECELQAPGIDASKSCWPPSDGDGEDPKTDVLYASADRRAEAIDLVQFLHFDSPTATRVTSGPNRNDVAGTIGAHDTSGFTGNGYSARKTSRLATGALELPAHNQSAEAACRRFGSTTRDQDGGESSALHFPLHAFEHHRVLESHEVVERTSIVWTRYVSAWAQTPSPWGSRKPSGCRTRPGRGEPRE
jgi:hypothetical protein